jgi:hypothetical protein
MLENLQCYGLFCLGEGLIGLPHSVLYSEITISEFHIQEKREKPHNGINIGPVFQGFGRIDRNRIEITRRP